MGPVIKLNKEIRLFIRFSSLHSFIKWLQNTPPDELILTKDITYFLITIENPENSNETGELNFPEILTKQKEKYLPEIIVKTAFQVALPLTSKKQEKRKDLKSRGIKYRELEKIFEKNRVSIYFKLKDTDCQSFFQNIKDLNRIFKNIAEQQKDFSKDFSKESKNIRDTLHQIIFHEDILLQKDNKPLVNLNPEGVIIDIDNLTSENLRSAIIPFVEKLSKTKKTEIRGSFTDDFLLFIKIPETGEELELLRKLKEKQHIPIILKYTAERGGGNFFGFEDIALRYTRKSQPRGDNINAQDKSYLLSSKKLSELIKLAYCLEQGLLNGVCVDVINQLHHSEINRYLQNIKLSFTTLGYGKASYRVISCPMCGRCTMNIEELATRIEKQINRLDKKLREKGIKMEDYGGITVAVMGCNVNGPGEAKSADIGVAGGKNRMATIFAKGKPVKNVSEEEIEKELLREIKIIINNLIKNHD